jgi:hypothetical protein
MIIATIYEYSFVRFFFTCALSQKLAAQQAGEKHNIDANELYKDVLLQGIPFDQWYGYIAAQLKKLQNH